MLLLAWLADTAAPGFDPVALLSQVGIGALIAGPVFLANRKQEARITALEALVATLQQARIDDRDQLLDRVARISTEQTQALREVLAAMDHTITRVREVPAQHDVQTRRLELAADELIAELKRTRTDRDRD